MKRDAGYRSVDPTSGLYMSGDIIPTGVHALIIIYCLE